MAQITSTGLGSGLDITGLVAQLVAAEGQPRSLRLDRREFQAQARLSAFGSLKGALSSFQSAQAALTALSNFQSRKATSGDTDILTASAGSTAAAGNYNIEVTTLAQAHSIVSSAYTGTSEVIGTGTLTISFGEDNAGVFTLNADRQTQTIDIDSSNNTLSGIRDAINAADVGVSASIINDGSGYRLALVSDYSGKENSIKITVADTSDADDLDNAGLSELAYDPEGTLGNGKNLNQTQDALDADFTVNGLSVTSDSNNITDVIEGVTLSLKGTTSGSPVSLTVERDDSTVTSAVNKFISEYNSLVNTINSLTSYDADTGQSGILLGDFTARSVIGQVRRLVTDLVPGLSGSYTSLVSLGITSQIDGTLELDSDKLTAALSSDPAAVGRLFAAVGTTTDSSVSFISSTSGTLVGNYAINISQLATQGIYTAATNSTLVVAGGTNTFTIKVDGTESDTITLSAQTYADGAALAKEFQSRINGDSALADAGIIVSVSYVTDHLEITSTRYGSASKVEITTDNTSNLGLSVSTGTDGVDVEGTINGLSVTGSGRFLTGIGDAEGLKIEIIGGATGARGAIRFTRGVSDQLDILLESLLDSDGILTSRTNGLDEQIDDIGDQREVLVRRLQLLEARYLAQFTALDLLVSQLQTTSNFLTQQLANMPAVKKA